ncbi:hypothetical protein C8R45DRAFT_62378 [Mycena sanguinolenta]|nr:hypothetical protein C8R45DRAFT_62378 [Mycena sanguinolenta]
MNCRKDYAILICLAGLGVAIVGYLLSVLSTLITRFTSRLLGHPKPTSATHSPHPKPTNSPSSSVSKSAAKPDNSDSVPEKTTLRSTPSKHRERREKLRIDVRDETPERDSKAGKLSESLIFGKLARGISPTRHVVHFRTPTSGIPIIAVSPPPVPRLSTQSDSSVSTDSQTSSSECNTSCSEATAAPAAPEEQPRGRRSRFAKIVQIFSDKRSSKPRRRDSLPSLRSRTGHAARASESSAVPPVPPLPPNLSVPSTPPSQVIPIPLPASDAAAAPALVPPSSPILRSKPVNQKTPGRRRSLIVRTASCPSLWYHGRCHSESSARAAVPAVPPIPQSPLLPQSPTRHEQPLASPTASPGAKKPKPRTHPYEAPYFLPPPDSVSVEKPLTIRRRPSRRQTSPTQSPGHERAGSPARARESVATAGHH